MEVVMGDRSMTAPTSKDSTTPPANASCVVMHAGSVDGLLSLLAGDPLVRSVFFEMNLVGRTPLHVFDLLL